MKYITVKLTEDQARQIVRILDYGKAEKSMDYELNRMVYQFSEDAQFNAFIQRIQDKIRKQLQSS